MDEDQAQAFKRECERIGLEEQADAGRIRERAGRLPLNSNRRRKLTAKAQELQEHAGTMLAASR